MGEQRDDKKGCMRCDATGETSCVVKADTLGCHYVARLERELADANGTLLRERTFWRDVEENRRKAASSHVALPPEPSVMRTDGMCRRDARECQEMEVERDQLRAMLDAASCAATLTPEAHDTMIEECAKVCDELADDPYFRVGTVMQEAAKRIRALKSAPRSAERERPVPGCTYPDCTCPPEDRCVHVAKAAPSSSREPTIAQEIEQALWSLHSYESNRDDAGRVYSEEHITKMVEAVRAFSSSVVRQTILEEAAAECERIWREAPNTRESGYRQNNISHGCIACAKALRELASPRSAKTLP